MKTSGEALMETEADAVCRAENGTRSARQTNAGDGFRSREWDSRAESLEVAFLQPCAGVAHILTGLEQHGCSHHRNDVPPGSRTSGNRK